MNHIVTYISTRDKSMLKVRYQRRKDRLQSIHQAFKSTFIYGIVETNWSTVNRSFWLLTLRNHNKERMISFLQKKTFIQEIFYTLDNGITHNKPIKFKKFHCYTIRTIPSEPEDLLNPKSNMGALISSTENSASNKLNSTWDNLERSNS